MNTNLYKQSVTVNKMTSTQTATGSFDPAYSERIASLSCALQYKSVLTTIEYNRLAYKTIVKMFCAYNSTTAAIDPKDRVVVDSSGYNAAFEGTYEIVKIIDAAGQQHHLELMLEAVT